MNDISFKKEYYEHCSICPVTVSIIQKIERTNMSYETLAKQCGVSVQAIKNLERADDCCVDTVKKLCDYFSIVRPESCPRINGL